MEFDGDQKNSIKKEMGRDTQTIGSTDQSMLQLVLSYDVKFTKQLVTFLLNYVPFRSLQLHCKALEISCHGIPWLAGWLAFCWMIDNTNLYEMQINFIFGLLTDIIFVANIKAATRRRRPAVNTDIFSFGPDKFSFPSGHASRCFFILCFFTCLYPLPVILWPSLFAWAFSVAISRVLIYRHHLLDILGGITLGILNALLLKILWLGPETSAKIITWVSEDYLPDGEGGT